MNKRLRVLYIIDGLHGGGKERQLIEILRSLYGSSEITMGVITFNKNKHYSEKVNELVPFFVVLNKRPTRLEPLFSIWKYIKMFKPDIIHTWDSLSSFYSYLPAKFFVAKFIDGSIRDAGVDKGWHRLMKRFLIKRADFALANSLAGLKAYNVKGEVIYNAIDLKRFLLQEKSNDFNIVMTANFTDYKDHKTFIAAAIKLVAEKVVNKVYLLGDGPYKDKYLNYIQLNHPETADSFLFMGAVYDVEEYLSKCKVGVLCSTPEYSEGLSNAVLEYMAAGLIPIVTNIGGSCEIVTDSVNGFLIEPGNVNAIIDLIRIIKNHPDNYLEQRINAKKTLQEKFSSNTNINKLKKIYKNLSGHD